jgi:8-oxo-dGTP pyrophosphatase MutT (NUDIX family)
MSGGQVPDGDEGVLEYRNRHWSVTAHQAHAGTRYIVANGPSVLVVPVLPNGRVVLLSVFRRPHRMHVTEFPGGALLDDAERPSTAAERELLEETGLASSAWTALGHLRPATALTTERCYVFAAQEAETVRAPAAGEPGRPFSLPSDAVFKALVDGGGDAVALAAWGLFDARFGRRG